MMAVLRTMNTKLLRKSSLKLAWGGVVSSFARLVSSLGWLYVWAVSGWRGRFGSWQWWHVTMMAVVLLLAGFYTLIADLLGRPLQYFVRASNFSTYLYQIILSLWEKRYSGREGKHAAILVTWWDPNICCWTSFGFVDWSTLDPSFFIGLLK